MQYKTLMDFFIMNNGNGFIILETHTNDVMIELTDMDIRDVNKMLDDYIISMDNTNKKHGLMYKCLRLHDDNKRVLYEFGEPVL